MNIIVAAAVNSAQKITSPGKFEGCPVWVKSFWEMVLEGFAEELYIDDQLWSIIHLEPEDCVAWPELQDIHSVWLAETSQGFIIYDLCSRGYTECGGCSELLIDTLICDTCLEGKTEDEEDEDFDEG